jgi:hypothetical protein
VQPKTVPVREAQQKHFKNSFRLLFYKNDSVVYNFQVVESFLDRQFWKIFLLRPKLLFQAVH